MHNKNIEWIRVRNNYHLVDDDTKEVIGSVSCGYPYAVYTSGSHIHIGIIEDENIKQGN